MNERVLVAPKPWYRSLTIWANIAAFLVAATPLFTAYIVQSGIGEDVANQIAGLTGLTSALINLALRIFATGSPIQGGGAMPPPPETPG